jgi:hypothetical protein
MRRIAIVIGVGLAAALAMTTSVSAQTEQKGSSGPAVGPARGETMAPTAPGKSTGPIRPTPIPGRKNVQLTEGECEGLGGRVLSIAVAYCKSGSLCSTTDKNGVIHEACITKK